MACRSIESEHFGSLALPVGEFLALEHGLEYWGIADHEQVKVALVLYKQQQMSCLIEQMSLDRHCTQIITPVPMQALSGRFSMCQQGVSCLHKLHHCSQSKIKAALHVLRSPAGLVCAATELQFPTGFAGQAATAGHRLLSRNQNLSNVCALSHLQRQHSGTFATYQHAFSPVPLSMHCLNEGARPTAVPAVLTWQSQVSVVHVPWASAFLLCPAPCLNA